jgi:hypothetical protein
MSRHSPCPCTLISVLRSGWFDSCDMALHGIFPPHARQFLPRACKRSCLRPGICLTLLRPSKKQKNAWNSRENALVAEKKNQMHEAQARKEVAPPNTRAFDNPKTDADWQGVCVLITLLARTPQTALLFSCSRIDLLYAELRSRIWREGGSARQRSLALVAKVAVTMQSVLQPILPMHIRRAACQRF